MTPWPVYLLLWLLALEGAMLILAPDFVKAVLAEASPTMLRIAGLIEIILSVIVFIIITT